MKKIIEYIKSEYHFIIFCAVMIFLLLFKLPYYVIIGGGLISVDDRINITTDYKEYGSFNLAYVKQARATIPTYLLSHIFDWDLIDTEDVKVSSSDSDKDIYNLDRVLLNEGNDNAIINAYRLANKEVNINSFTYQVLYIYDVADTDLEIGDMIKSIDNIVVDNNTNIKEIIDKHEFKEKINIKVLRDNKEIDCYSRIVEYENEKRLAILLTKRLDYEVSPEIKLNFKKNESGSSGGLLLSLAIYNRLVPDDITHGLKIAGTGTIELNGTVGEIDGVKYKIKAAINDKADIFIVPEGNYEEALKEYQKYDTKMKLVKVNTFQEAVNYLEGYND